MATKKANGESVVALFEGVEEKAEEIKAQRQRKPEGIKEKAEEVLDEKAS